MNFWKTKCTLDIPSNAVIIQTRTKGGGLVVTNREDDRWHARVSYEALESILDKTKAMGYKVASQEQQKAVCERLISPEAGTLIYVK